MRITSKEMKGIFAALAEKMTANMTNLVELDSVAGDGDLGLAMVDGFTAVEAATRDSDETDIGKLLYLAGKTLSSSAPSTTGTLLASGIIKGAREMMGTTEMSLEELTRFSEAMLEGICALGGAKTGEKTIVDGLAPAVDRLKAACADGDMMNAVKEAKEASRIGAEQTVDMVAVHGRVAVKGENSRGIIDAGAVTVSLLIEAISDFLESLIMANDGK